MGNDDLLTDEYVANLLTADAKQSNIKYSTMGLDAFATSRPPTNKPKPNTRFLRNIIKDTDSHNAALLAKEAADAKARLTELSRSGKPKPVSGGDIRKRQLGDIASILGGGPKRRKRVVEEALPEQSERNSSGRGEDGRERSRRDRNSETDRKAGNEKRSSRDHKSSHRRERSGSRNRHTGRSHRRSDRSRSGSPTKERTSERRHRERSPRRKRSRSRERKDPSRPQQRYYSIREKMEAKSRNEQTSSSAMHLDEDSDPLDEIIGPKPPPEVRARGRGAVSAGSGIDSRFSKGYDPTTDVALDFDEENDWEQALEALKDRQKWKQQGADRLRAAGFTDEEVKKWEKGGEKREEDVTWAKAGEGREWDRGKFVNDEGVVAFDPSYGRLTDE